MRSRRRRTIRRENGSSARRAAEHIVRAKSAPGSGSTPCSSRRRPTGEIWSLELHARYPGRDWILTRILWLRMQPGKNRLREVDTMRRYIYIHGSHDMAEMGKPGRSDCVRMRSQDIVELFDLGAAYTPSRSASERLADPPAIRIQHPRLSPHSGDPARRC